MHIKNKINCKLQNTNSQTKRLRTTIYQMIRMKQNNFGIFVTYHIKFYLAIKFLLNNNKKTYHLINPTTATILAYYLHNQL